MNKRLYFYFHAGSKNHGCEAIVRATQRLLNTTPTLVSFAPEDDKKYGIDKVANIKRNGRESDFSVFDKIACVVGERLLKTEKYSYGAVAKHESRTYEGPAVAFSIGGDNYCYGKAYDYHLAGLNKYLHRRDIKTVLWGCSCEPARLDRDMIKDLAAYDLIVARETLTYECLKKYNKNTVLACDPAFFLEKEEVALPEGFAKGRTVGINISPMIQSNERIEGITMGNYRALVQHIIDTTDMQIALIPHVVIESNDDRKPLKALFDEFSHTGRVVMIDDCNCCRIKGFISECAMFIGARTHATIAAYSTGVPTLVIGYSTKATGIAKDLFGTDENYVLPVQSLKKRDDMILAFEWLSDNREEIRAHLARIMPDYKASMQAAILAVEKL